MRQVKEILRMKYSLGMSVRQIARSLGLSTGVVCKYLRRAEAKGWSWPLTAEVDESTGLQDLGPARAGGDTHGVPWPDFAQVHQELKRKGVTRQLLWQEYRERYAGEGLSYAHFCLLYRQWRARLKRSLRQTHVAGEKVFVDYCGPTVPVIDRQTGELWQAQIFVAVLGASNYTFAEATRSQTSLDWIGSHERMLRYFGGVPVLLVPDNLLCGAPHKRFYVESAVMWSSSSWEWGIRGSFVE
jgi:transposase